MMRRFAALLLTVCSTFSLVWPFSPIPPFSDRPPIKVTRGAWAATANNARAAVIVGLPGYPDLSVARSLPTKEAKTRYVYDTLTDYAAKAQKSLRLELTRRGITYRVLWLSNSIAIRSSDRVTLDWLSRRLDVSKVQLDAMAPGVQSGVDTATVASGNTQPRTPATVEWGVRMVKAPEAWALGYRGQGIVIADLDTGVMWDHAALKPHYRGWNTISATHDYNWYDAIDHSAAPQDPYGHGTHTVGTLVGDDGLGNQVGVAPGARWIGCRNMDANGYGSVSSYTECFQFAIAPTKTDGSAPNPAFSADITSNSWSCAAGPEVGCDDPTALITITQSMRDAGIMVIAAAQNYGSACSSVREAPGMLHQAFSVGAVDSGGYAASFSSRGPSNFTGKVKPDLVAPGVNVYSSDKYGGYVNMSGTSMATPHVAGVVALLWSAAPGLRGEVDDTEAILRRSATPIGANETCGGLPANSVPNNTYGYGLINARAAVSEAFLGKLVTTGAQAGLPGQLVTVSLTIRNYTFFTRTNVILTATVPVTAFVVSVDSRGKYSAGIVGWNLRKLPPLGSVRVNVVLTTTQSEWVSLMESHVKYTDGITGMIYTQRRWLPLVAR